jgi:hypothetical protein
MPSVHPFIFFRCVLEIRQKIFIQFLPMFLAINLSLVLMKDLVEKKRLACLKQLKYTL